MDSTGSKCALELQGLQPNWGDKAKIINHGTCHLLFNSIFKKVNHHKSLRHNTDSTLIFISSIKKLTSAITCFITLCVCVFKTLSNSTTFLINKNILLLCNHNSNIVSKRFYSYFQISPKIQSSQNSQLVPKMSFKAILFYFNQDLIKLSAPDSIVICLLLIILSIFSSPPFSFSGYWLTDSLKRIGQLQNVPFSDFLIFLSINFFFSVSVSYKLKIRPKGVVKHVS